MQATKGKTAFIFLIGATAMPSLGRSCAESGRGGSETTAVLGSVVSDIILTTSFVASLILAAVGLALLWFSTRPKEAWACLWFAVSIYGYESFSAWRDRSVQCEYQHDAELCGETPIQTGRAGIKLTSSSSEDTWQTPLHSLIATKTDEGVLWKVEQRAVPHVSRMWQASHVVTLSPSQTSQSLFPSVIYSRNADSLVALLPVGLIQFRLDTDQVDFSAIDLRTNGAGRDAEPRYFVDLTPNDLVFAYRFSLLQVHTGKDARAFWISQDVGRKGLRYVDEPLREARATENYFCFGPTPDDRAWTQSTYLPACAVSARTDSTLNPLERARAAFGSLGLIAYFVTSIVLATVVYSARRVSRGDPVLETIDSQEDYWFFFERRGRILSRLAAIGWVIAIAASKALSH